MSLEIDQSGRIEETQRATVIAIANTSHSFAISIPAKAKRNLKKYFRLLKKPRMFPVKVFAVSVAIAIHKSKFKPTVLVIDKEYPGHEITIAETINKLTKGNIDVRYKLIGKKSPAHIRAYYTYKKKLPIDFIVSEKMILRAIKK